MQSDFMRNMILGIVALFALFTLNSALFTVSETQQAIVVQFGQPRLIYRTPGLKVKVPFVQDVVYFEKRILDLMPTELHQRTPLILGSKDDVADFERFARG
mgnify:CR=1 FL=1